MRGSELTAQELEAAEVFVRGCQSEGPAPEASSYISLPFEQLVRLVAWYGAIRGEAVAKGADPRVPGGVIERKK